MEQAKVEATAENVAEDADSSDHASAMQKDKDRSEKRTDTEVSVPFSSRCKVVPSFLLDC